MRVSSQTVTAPRVHVDRPNPVAVGTIVWLASELMFFAGLFAMYFTHRSVNADQWPAGVDHLNIPFSTINTLILISSSVTAQMGVWAAERYQARRSGSVLDFRRWGTVEWFTLTFVLGSIFVAGQIFEYAELFQAGLTIESSYGSVFFITTGFHGLHVLGGLIAFLLVIARTFAARRFGHHEATSAVVVSYYWHFVDVVWIALFTTIYIIQ